MKDKHDSKQSISQQEIKGRSKHALRQKKIQMLYCKIYGMQNPWDANSL